MKDYILGSFYILILGLVFIFNSLYYGFSPLEFDTPSGHIFRSTKSYVETGSFESSSYVRMHNKLIVKSKNHSGAFKQDSYSHTIWGTFLNKQTPMFALLQVPVYKFFGMLGIYLAQFMLLALIVCCYLSKSDSGSGSKPIVVVMLVVLGTELFQSSYSYGYDLFYSTLLFVGALAIERFPVAGGLAIGFSVFIKPLAILFFPLFLIYSCFEKVLIRFSIGLLLTLALLFVFNKVIFGGWLTFSYFRIPMYLGGQMFYENHGVGFSISRMISSIPGLLFSKSYGWLVYNPLVLVLPICFDVMTNARLKNFVILSLSIAVVNFLYITSYEYNNASIGGNRFLLPATIFLSWIVAIKITSIFTTVESRNELDTAT